MSISELEQQVREQYFVECKLHMNKNSVGGEYPDPARSSAFLDGGRDGRGVNHNSLWKSIVSFAAKHGMDPLMLVTAVFATHNRATLPLPSMFTGRSAIEAYNYYQKEHAIDVEYEFSAFRNSVKYNYWLMEQTMRDTTPEELLRLVIVDPGLNCGALFRYCLALETKQEDIAIRYRHSALLEYITNIHEYDKILRNQLPEDFKLAGRNLREKFKHV